MNIVEQRAELVIVNALRQLAGMPGQAVNVKRLRAIWDEYGVRAADLAEAVERMVHDERLLRVRDGEHQALTLTPKGEAWSRAQPACIEYLLLVPRRARVAWRRQSGVQHPAASLARRSDRSPAAA